MKKIFFPALLLCLAAAGFKKAAAQDVHFSQFWELPVLRNPALLGLSRGDYQATALYRNQWSSIGNAFTTGLLHAELRRPVRVTAESSDFLSFGLVAYTDRAGSVGLRTTAAYGAVAYNKFLGGTRRSYLSAGLTGGYLQRSFDPSRMTVDNQWVNGSYVALAATKENISTPKLHGWDLGAGLSFSSAFGPDNAHSFLAGISAYSLTKPRWNFNQSDPPVYRPMRVSAQLGAAFTLSEKYRIETHANLTRQGEATEVVVGGMAHWQKKPEVRGDPSYSLGAGFFYRHGDALMPVVRLNYKAMTLMATYDVNISPLRAATALRGGYEMSLIYTGFFFDPKSEWGAMNCPVF